MAPSRWNPIAFTPWPVAFFTILTYISLLVPLITLHNVVPPAPSDPAPYKGINLTEAWWDLQVLTNGYHPYNSRRNDEVRDWLLTRIEGIIKQNTANKAIYSSAAEESVSAAPAVIFNDITSNLTFSSSDSAISIAFTGTNIMVYIRGTEDEPGLWWNKVASKDESTPRKGGVLVNAHFDSVPSGFGATDDGVGVISILQLISFFTIPEHQPKRGIVALLNNGEEDYLNGAYAFSQHPLSSFPHTFLNLEGAGAGGRAVLFRSTDTEVTRFYKAVPHPFGTVISADGFKRKLVRSQTDYVVFNGDLGMRGLDVAFMEPRSRYHTQEDSTTYTSKRSLWHMLSAAIATMQGLTSDTSDQFDGPISNSGKVNSGTGTDSVWFDLFGRTFAVFELHTLFAISVTLLVVTPLILIGLTVVVIRADKWYPFTSREYVEDMDDSARIDGLRSIARAPVVFIVASAALIGIAYLLVKVNPYIMYGSEYAVWAMMLSLWFCISWFLLKGADSMRASALQRMYSLIWIYIGTWILLVAATVGENNFHLAGGYFLVFYFGAVFLALIISYLELLALSTKDSYARIVVSHASYSEQRGRSANLRSSTGAIDAPAERNSTEANERTSLLQSDGGQQTFSRNYGANRTTSHGSEVDNSESYAGELPQPYENEQAWSGKLPSWTWLIQFLILGPFPIILVTQIGLFMTSALHQTPADGNEVLPIYTFMALLCILLLTPVFPFIHRFSYMIPLLLFIVFIATLLYNLLAFPFTDGSRLKIYFLQKVNLETGINQVALTGLSPYVENIIDSLPSSAGQPVNCSSPEYTAKNGLKQCSWSGPPPNVLNVEKKISSESTYSTWLNYTVSRNGKDTSATLHISGNNTRACRVFFETPLTSLEVKGFTTDPDRFPLIGNKGCKSIRLWSREWQSNWDLDVSWNGTLSNDLDGRVVCLWSDANNPETIPAFEEVRRFMPRWSIATKLSDGLVEGFKEFKI